MNNYQQKEIVFTSVPWADTGMPLMAPAVLKSIAIKAGRTAIAVDLNMRSYQLLNQVDYKDELIQFFRTGVNDRNIQQRIFELFTEFAETLLVYNPSIIGISVFSYTSKISTRYLAMMIKKLAPDVKIIIGGAGLSANFDSSVNFAETMVQQNLVDFYINGDGENSLYEYLTLGSQNVIGLNTDEWQQLTNEDLRKLPVPDYDDYQLDQYTTDPDKLMLPMLTSRGCVRNCTFCDVHTHWKKFTWRSGEHIFEEMLTLYKKHSNRNFMFNDSLVNGNMKEYNVLIQLLSQYNLSRPESEKLQWAGFFILRPMEQFKEDQWKLIADSGGIGLQIGIETLNDQARFHLGKKFTNKDIEFALQMAKKYNIILSLLFLVGYVTETDADNDFAVKWYEDHVEYRDILRINVGTPLGIIPNTPLYDNFDRLGLVRTGPNPEDWSNPALGNTPLNRLRWKQRIDDVVDSLNYQRTDDSADQRYIFERMMRDAINVQ
jgi:radical SAM superfamily enzyme YgiQ (UPF0313 family)